MKLLFDFLPIIIFFATYLISGNNIYMATGVVIITSILQVAWFWWQYRKIETLLLTNCILIVLFGGATLLFHKSIFVKWKVSIIYWLYSGALLFSQWMMKKPLLAKALESNFELPLPIWKRANFACAIYFAVLGSLNLWIAYHFSTDFWVKFKFFGILGFTFLFFFALSYYLSKYIIEPEEPKKQG